MEKSWYSSYINTQQYNIKLQPSKPQLPNSYQKQQNYWITPTYSLLVNPLHSITNWKTGLTYSLLWIRSIWSDNIASFIFGRCFWLVIWPYYQLGYKRDGPQFGYTEVDSQ